MEIVITPGILEQPEEVEAAPNREDEDDEAEELRLRVLFEALVPVGSRSGPIHASKPPKRQS